MSEAAPGGAAPAAPAGNSNPGNEGGGGQQNAGGAEDKGGQGKQNTPPPAPKRFITRQTEDGKQERLAEEDLLKELDRYRKNEKKYGELSQKEKNLNAFFERLQADPESVLADKRLPLDRRKLAMKWLQESVQEELRFSDPKDEAIHKLNERIREFEERDAQSKQTEEEKAFTAQRERVVKERSQHFEQIFSKAMEISPLAKDPETSAETLRAMAIEYRIAKKALGGEEPDPADLAAAVEKKYYKSMFSAAGKLTGEDLINFLGKDIITKVRMYDLDQLQKKRSTPPPQTAENWEPSKQTKTSGFVDPYELTRQIRGK